MALRGEKDATKDIDLIVRSPSEAEELKRAFESLGFRVDSRHPDECCALVDATILSIPTGLRADIFVENVCNKLRLSEGVVDRQEVCLRSGHYTLKPILQITHIYLYALYALTPYHAQKHTTIAQRYPDHSHTT